MMTEPKGYWSRVFHQATVLMNSHRDLNGDSAYWMARRLVDEAKEHDQLFSPMPGQTGTASTLVLAP
jgi:hypothetical protein